MTNEHSEFINNTQMFEWPKGSKHVYLANKTYKVMQNCYGNDYELLIDGSTYDYCSFEEVMEAQESFYCAKLQARGWTPPMPPLCMKSAIECGYSRELEDGYHLIKYRDRVDPDLIYVSDLELTHFEITMNADWFLPCDKFCQAIPEEYQRAVDAEVKQYENKGE